MALNLEDLVYYASSCLLKHLVDELLEDAVIPLFVSHAKIALRYRLTDPQMINLLSMSLKSHNQISKDLAIGKLAEHHRK